LIQEHRCEIEAINGKWRTNQIQTPAPSLVTVYQWLMEDTTSPVARILMHEIFHSFGRSRFLEIRFIGNDFSST
jgi:hypothetical protein